MWVFENHEVCGQTVFPDRSIVIGQKMMENAKIEKLKCNILGDFQTLCISQKILFNFVFYKNFSLFQLAILVLVALAYAFPVPGPDSDYNPDYYYNYNGYYGKRQAEPDYGYCEWCHCCEDEWCLLLPLFAFEVVLMPKFFFVTELEWFEYINIKTANFETSRKKTRKWLKAKRTNSRIEDIVSDSGT